MKRFCCIFTMLAFMASVANAVVFAVAEGSYSVSNMTYYVNPDTGKSDDGGDTSIGEGMCRNTVYPQSLYEYKDGKHYTVLRLKLISFIRNITFEVQSVKGDKASYKQASYTVVGENKSENTMDFRIGLPAGDVLIKPSFFVGPMNRDVTFFLRLDISTAKADEGAFAAYNLPAGSDGPSLAEQDDPGGKLSPAANEAIGSAGAAEQGKVLENTAAQSQGVSTAGSPKSISGNTLPADVKSEQGEPGHSVIPAPEPAPVIQATPEVDGSQAEQQAEAGNREAEEGNGPEVKGIVEFKAEEVNEKGEAKGFPVVLVLEGLGIVCLAGVICCLYGRKLKK